MKITVVSRVFNRNTFQEFYATEVLNSRKEMNSYTKKVLDTMLENPELMVTFKIMKVEKK